MPSEFVVNPLVGKELGASLTMRNEMGERADEIAETARKLAPVLTGELEESIEAEVTFDDGEWHGHSRATAPYAAFVEFGTVDTPAQPFMRPAADEVAR